MNRVNIAFCHALQTKNGYYSIEYLTATVEILQRLIFLSVELQRTRNRNAANLQCVRRNEMKQSIKARSLSVFQLCEALSYSNQRISDACIYCLYKIVNGKCFEQKCELRFFSICFGSLDSNYSCHLGLTQARRVSEISKTISPKQTSKKYSPCRSLEYTEKAQRIFPQEDSLPLASVYLKIETFIELATLQIQISRIQKAILFCFERSQAWKVQITLFDSFSLHLSWLASKKNCVVFLQGNTLQEKSIAEEEDLRIIHSFKFNTVNNNVEWLTE